MEDVRWASASLLTHCDIKPKESCSILIPIFLHLESAKLKLKKKCVCVINCVSFFNTNSYESQTFVQTPPVASQACWPQTSPWVWPWSHQDTSWTPPGPAAHPPALTWPDASCGLGSNWTVLWLLVSSFIMVTNYSVVSHQWSFSFHYFSVSSQDVRLMNSETREKQNASTHL